MKRYFYIILLSFLALFSSCVYTYEPSGVKQEEGILVIEGDINAGIESSFTLSSSVKVNDNAARVKNVTPTEIYVEAADGTKYELSSTTEETNGNFDGGVRINYLINTELLDISQKHRFVAFANGKQYVSSWQSFIQAPEIDSITYSVPEDRSKLEIFVSSRGVEDSLRYYKYDYEEDWEFTSKYLADYYYDIDSNKVFSLPFSENKYYCWNHSTSSNINILNIESLSENVVSQHLVRTIYPSDIRISYIYSIEVYQKVLSKESYTYWEMLLKNNEQTSGIFAPQPNEMRGNLLCVEDDNEVVLGYVNAYSVSRKRIFINNIDIKVYQNNDNCALETKSSEMWKSLYNSGWDVYSVDPMSGSVDWTPRRCVNCLTMGTKNKPDFWPTSDN